MSLPDADLDATPAGSKPGLGRSALAAFGWAIAGAIGGGISWLASLAIARRLLTDPLPLIGPGKFTEIVMAGVGAACGFLSTAVADFVRYLRGHRDQRADALLAWLGGAFVGAIGGGLTPLLIGAFAGVLPADASSSLAWSIAGLLAGLLCYGRSRLHGPTGTSLALAWSAAAGLVTGAAWIVGLLVTGFPGVLNWPVTDAALVMAGGGAGVGVIVGVAMGLLRGGEHRRRAATVLGTCGAMAGALGGVLSQLPGIIADAKLLLAVTSSLAWAFAGMLTGVVGYVWSRWNVERPAAEDDEEEPAQPPPAGATLLPREPARRVRPGPIILRVLPIVAVSVASLVGAALLWPATVALSLLAVGCLGCFVALVLGDQEYRLRDQQRRLRDLEHRFRGWS
jgi:hypothetical protein